MQVNTGLDFTTEVNMGASDMNILLGVVFKKHLGCLYIISFWDGVI